jgi:phage/plasmid-associated DNA primase
MNYPFKNNLTLDPKIYKKSIYGAKQKYREYVSKTDVCSLIKNHQDYIYTQDSPQKRQFNCVKDQLKKYLKQYNDKGYFEIDTALPKHKWGRQNPVGQVGLSVLHRSTRHSLVHKNYMDCDMVNAQPFIISEIIKQNKCNTRDEQELRVPFLEQYCDNRDAMLVAVQEHYGVVKDDTKKLIIAILNGGHYLTWENKMKINHMETGTPQDIIQFYEDYQPVLRLIYENNKKIIDDVLEKQKDLPDHYDITEYNERQQQRTAGALFYTTIERHLQETAIEYLVRRKGFILTEDIIPSQDGFMYRKHRHYEDLIDDVQEIVASKWGIEIKFKLKEFDEKFDILPFDDAIDWDRIITRTGIAEYTANKLGDSLCLLNGSIYVYLENKWMTDDDADIKLKRYINTVIYEDFRELIESNYIEDDLPKRLKELRTITETKTAFTDIIQQIKGIVKPPAEPFDSKPYLLPFKNGVFDLALLEFKKVNKCFRPITKEDYIMLDTGYDYVEETNKRKIEEVSNYLKSIMPDEPMYNLLLQYLASALDGKLYQRFFMLIGQGGNGKGSIIDFMKMILGGFFVKASNSLLKNWGDTAGGANSDLIDLKNKRMVIFEEMGKSKVALDTNLLNNLTGGDTQRTREIFKKKEDIEIPATYGGTANVPPTITSCNESDKRRWVMMPFNQNFTENRLMWGRKCKIDGQEITYREGNAKFTDPHWYKEHQMAFLQIILEAYEDNILEQRDTYYEDKRLKAEALKEDECMEPFKFIKIQFNLPECVKAITEKFLNAGNLIDKAFSRSYIKTNKKTDRIKIKEIKESILSSDTFQRATEFDRKKYSEHKEFEKYIGSKLAIVKDKHGTKVVEFYRLRDATELTDYDKQNMEDEEEEDKETETTEEALDDDECDSDDGM